MSTLPAKWSVTREATQAIQSICDQVKPDVEKKTGTTYVNFKAYQYREQIVTSTNYLIRVFIGELSCIDIEVIQLPSGEGVVLGGVQETQTQDGPLKPFPPFLPDDQ